MHFPSHDATLFNRSPWLKKTVVSAACQHKATMVQDASITAPKIVNCGIEWGSIIP